MADTATPPRPKKTADPEAAEPGMPLDPDLDEAGDPEQNVTVIQALNRVMRDVRVLRKQREQKSSGGTFKFRGIDDAMNALGPVFRRHGVICIPTLVSVDVEHGTTKAGGGMTITRVQVDYTFHGPKGDTITARVPGESFDSGDKSTAKAMSVAYRTCLLQTFTLPTDEPDPDNTVEELAPRSSGQQRAPQPPREDPWRSDLTAEEKHYLAGLMREDDADKLRAAWHQAKQAQDAMHDLTVKPGDVTQQAALTIGIALPAKLIDVVGAIGTHLADVGISVLEHIAAEERK